MANVPNFTNFTSLLNSTFSSNTTVNSQYVLKFDAVNTIDNISRIWSLVSHVLYFVVVLTHRELMTINLFPMHHVNIIGLMVAIHYCCWIDSVALNLPDQTANNVLCSMAEAFFAVFRFARMYAVLVLAIHRIVAVFFVSSYKEVSESIKYTVLSAALVWVAGILVFVAGKYGGHTVPGGILCIDGSSPFLINSIIYYIITSSFGFIIPFVVVIVFYKMITTRLGQISARLNKNKKKSPRPEANKQFFSFLQMFSSKSRVAAATTINLPNNSYSLGPGETLNLDGTDTDYPEPTAGETNCISTDESQKNRTQLNTQAVRRAEYIRQMNENNREKRLTKQFFQINLYEAGSAIALIALYICNTIPNFNTYYYWFRQISRAANLFFQSIIPIATLFYHPFKFKPVRHFKKIMALK